MPLVLLWPVLEKSRLCALWLCARGVSAQAVPPCEIKRMVSTSGRRACICQSSAALHQGQDLAALALRGYGVIASVMIP